MNVMGRAQPSAWPEAGLGATLAWAFLVSFLLAMSLSAASTWRDAVTLVVVLPAISCVALITALFGMRHLAEGSPGYAWAERAKSISVTTLNVYFLLVLPMAVLSLAGRVFQGG